MGASIQGTASGPGKVHASLGFRREEAQRELEDAYRVLGMTWAPASAKRAAQRIVNEQARNTDPSPAGQRVDAKKTFPPEQIARVESARDVATQNLDGFNVLADVEYESVSAICETTTDVIARVSYTSKVENADEAAVAVRFRRPQSEQQWNALLGAIALAATVYEKVIARDAITQAEESIAGQSEIDLGLCPGVPVHGERVDGSEQTDAE